MPSLRKRILKSGTVVWDIRYTEGGKQRSFHIGETDRRTAEKVFHKFCNNLAEGKIGDTASSPVPDAPSPRLSELADHAKAFAQSNKSTKTLEREQQALQSMIRMLGDIPISDITASLIEQYKAERLKKASPQTVNIEIRVLNTAVNQAVELGWLREPTRNRFKQIRTPEAEPPEWLSNEQIESLLNTDDDDFRRFLVFLLHTGCRRNEALGVTWEDVDLERRQLVIRGRVGKMGKRRIVPLNDTLLELLSKWPRLKSGKLFPSFEPNQVSMKFRRRARVLGLPSGISLHSLRATFACKLIGMGVDIYTVSRLLGHSSVRVTEKSYVALSQDHIQRAVKLLDNADR